MEVHLTELAPSAEIRTVLVAVLRIALVSVREALSSLVVVEQRMWRLRGYPFEFLQSLKISSFNGESL